MPTALQHPPFTGGMGAPCSRIRLGLGCWWVSVSQGCRSAERSGTNGKPHLQCRLAAERDPNTQHTGSASATLYEQATGILTSSHSFTDTISIMDSGESRESLDLLASAAEQSSPQARIKRNTACVSCRDSKVRQPTSQTTTRMVMNKRLTGGHDWL